MINEMLIKGKRQHQIAKEMQITPKVVSKDVAFLREQAKENLKRVVDETLPFEYERCLDNIRLILEKAWLMADHAEQTHNIRDQQLAYSLVLQCNTLKMELLTKGEVVYQALRFVESKKPLLLKPIEQPEVTDTIAAASTTIDNGNGQADTDTEFNTVF
jgi:hypothetical protein